jgi:hypothetical protein
VPQSDGKNRLKRMEFVYKGQSYVFSINPEEYTQEEPSRSTVTQTKGGAWVDDFGGGLPVITIRGTTGFQKGLGVQKFKELRDMIRKYYDDGSELTFHNWTDDESWIVHPDPSGFRLLRNKTNPLLYMYEMRLICLRLATHPKASATASGGVAQSLGIPAPLAETASSSVDAIQPFIETQLNINNITPEPIVAAQLIKKLRIAPDGKVQDVTEYSAEHPTEYSFIPKVSLLAVSAFDRYKSSPEVKNLFAVEDTLTAQLMDLEKRNAPPNLLTVFRMILLELMALWEKVGVNPSEVPKSVSEAELSRLRDNIHWLAEEWFKRKEYDIAYNLRWLSRCIDHIRSFYDVTYKQEVGELNNVLR